MPQIKSLLLLLPKLFLSVLLIFLFNKCAEEKASNEPSFKIFNENGIKVAQNFPKKLKSKNNIKLKLHLTIGGMETEDPNQMFAAIQAVARDKKGNYYISDVKLKKIFVYDSTGKFLRNIGRQGNGPGEFLSPSHLVLDNNDNLLVASVGRVQIFPYNDENYKNVKNLQLNTFAKGFVFLKNNALALYQEEWNKLATKDSTRYRAYIVDSTLTLKKGLLRYKSDKEIDSRRDSDVGFLTNNILKLTKDKNFNLFIAEENSNQFYKFSPDGELLLKFNRELNYSLKPFFGKKDYSTVYNYSCFNMAVDSKSRLWVESPVRGYSTDEVERAQSRKGRLNPLKRHLEIYDNDGHLLAINDQLVDKYFVLKSVSGDKLMFMDYQRVTVYIYQIIEK